MAALAALGGCGHLEEPNWPQGAAEWAQEAPDGHAAAQQAAHMQERLAVLTLPASDDALQPVLVGG